MHSTLKTLHSGLDLALCTGDSALETLQSALETLQSALETLHSALETLHSALCIKRPPELAQELTAACKYQHFQSNAFAFKKVHRLRRYKNS